ncbi:MAG: hypothetical protein AAF990_24050 [Bacteroidota bacterium]
MIKKIYLLVVLLYLSKLCLGQHSTNLVRDASLTYIDLIAKNNLLVEENRNQHIINWGEVPYKIEGVSKIKETFFTSVLDSTQSIDTTIFIEAEKGEASKLFSQILEYKKIDDNILKIVIDSSFIVTYKDNVLVSQEEYGQIMRFNYYPSGLLKELMLSTGPLLTSKQSKDTTIYTVNLSGHLEEDVIAFRDFPTINIKCYKSDDKKCFHYENIFFFKEMLAQPVVNKEIIQCQNGSVVKEVVLDRYKKYAQKDKDYDFHYDDLVLMKKTCKPDVQYAEYKDIEYMYDVKGNIKKIIGNNTTSEFEYDERNNVVSRLDYSTRSNMLRKLWIREIEYEK